MADIVKRENMYLAEVDSVADTLGTLRENIGAEGITRFDFPRYKVPTGGAAHLMDPKGEPVKTVSGLIVLTHMSRSYWPPGPDGKQEPKPGELPSCSSQDAVTGVGDPGGRCEDCKFSRPGSGGGKRQACKLTRNVYLLQPGQVLPVLVQVPPASLSAARKYIFELSSFNKPLWTVVTRMGAKGNKSASGIAYSEITFAKEKDLEGEELTKAIQYASAFREAIIGPPEEEE